MLRILFISLVSVVLTVQTHSHATVPDVDRLYQMVTPRDLRIRLTPTGVEYVNRFKTKLLEKTLSELYQLQDFDESINWIENPAVIRSINATVISTKAAVEVEDRIDSGEGISRKSRGGTMRITGAWHREGENDPLGLPNKLQYFFGNYTVEFGNSYTHYLAHLEPTAAGGLAVNVTHCHTGPLVLINASVTSDPNLSQPADLTRKIEVVQALREGHRRQLEQTFCLLVPHVLSKGTETTFGTLPVTRGWPLVTEMKIEYKLEQAVYTEDSVDLYQTGDIFWKDDHVTSDGTARSVKLPENWTDKMLIVQVSDRLLNSQFNVAYTLGLLKKTITKDDLGKKGDLLATTCPQLCIGRFSEQLRKNYPKRFINFAIEAAAPVMFTTGPTNGTEFEGRAHMRIFLPAGKSEPEKELIHGLIGITGRISGMELQKSAILKGDMKVTGFEVMETTSTLADLQGTKLDKLTAVIKDHGRALMDKYLQRHFGGGIPLPLPGSLKIGKKPTVTPAENGINIGMDFKLEA